MYDSEKEIMLDKPAIVIELKWDKSADGALEQIKGKNSMEMH